MLGWQLELWREHAHKTLPVLMRATSMLVCGEDLGFLAPCVHPLMKELGLIGALPAPAHALPAHPCGPAHGRYETRIRDACCVTQISPWRWLLASSWCV